MATIKPATLRDVQSVQRATELLREARDLLKSAGAGQSVEKVRSAIKSAEGAERHVARRYSQAMETERAAGLRARAKVICEAEPGYGTPAYRGDPYEAVALQQEADRIEPR